MGWSVLEEDAVTNEPVSIEDLGVRIFDRAENPKNGDSLALPRRKARSVRRRLRRRKHRLERLRKLFVRAELHSKEELQNLYVCSSLRTSRINLRNFGTLQRLYYTWSRKSLLSGCCQK